MNIIYWCLSALAIFHKPLIASNTVSWDFDYTYSVFFILLFYPENLRHWFWKIRVLNLKFRILSFEIILTVMFFSLSRISLFSSQPLHIEIILFSQTNILLYQISWIYIFNKNMYLIGFQSNKALQICFWNYNIGL